MTQKYQIEKELLGPTPRRIIAAECGRGIFAGIGCLVLLLAPFVVVGLWMLYQSASASLVASCGVDMPGRVTQRRLAASSEDWPQIGFTYRHGSVQYHGSSEVSEEDYRHAEIGQPVTIHALSWAPSVAPILLSPCGCSNRASPENWELTIFWNVFMGLFIWGIATMHTPMRLLVRDGRPAAGHIVEKTVDAGGDSTSYHVHYEFFLEQTSSGAVKGEQIVSREQWECVSAGEMVTVLYHEKHPGQNILYRFSRYRAADF